MSEQQNPPVWGSFRPESYHALFAANQATSGGRPRDTSNASSRPPMTNGSESLDVYTIDPSDSVSRSHSPSNPPEQQPEVNIPRQSTDEENMFALGDILGRAEKHQKRLRLERMRASRFGQAPPPPPAPEAQPSAPASAPTVAAIPPAPTSISLQPPSSLDAAHPAPNASQINTHASFMPPDPFAGAPNYSFEPMPKTPPVIFDSASPPAAPFVPNSPSVLAPPPPVPPTPGPDGLPWIKEILAVGLYPQLGNVNLSGNPEPIPVVIAAAPDQNIQPEIWPNRPFTVHTSNLNYVNLQDFRNALDAAAIPRCILLPYLDSPSLKNNPHAQVMCRTAYERLTHTLLERGCYSRHTFPIPGGPPGTGVALYPRFDHYDGGYHLYAAVFSGVPVPATGEAPTTTASLPGSGPAVPQFGVNVAHSPAPKPQSPPRIHLPSRQQQPPPQPHPLAVATAGSSFNVPNPQSIAQYQSLQGHALSAQAQNQPLPIQFQFNPTSTSLAQALPPDPFALSGPEYHNVNAVAGFPSGMVPAPGLLGTAAPSDMGMMYGNMGLGGPNLGVIEEDILMENNPAYTYPAVHPQGWTMG